MIFFWKYLSILDCFCKFLKNLENYWFFLNHWRFLYILESSFELSFYFSRFLSPPSPSKSAQKIRGDIFFFQNTLKTNERQISINLKWIPLFFEFFSACLGLSKNMIFGYFSTHKFYFAKMLMIAEQLHGCIMHFPIFHHCVKVLACNFNFYIFKI